jgi:hypothetical protein
MGARIVYARRRTLPLRVGLVHLQFDCQFSSATVTNPALTPVETNANLRLYHPDVNLSTVE